MFEFLNLKKVDIKRGMPKLKDAPLESHSFLTWMWYLIRGHKGLLLLTTTNSLIRQLIMGMLPFFLGKIANELTYPSELYGIHSALFWFYLFICLFVFNYLLFFLYQYNIRVSTLVKQQFSLLTLKHYFTLPLAWHERNATGENLQKISQARNGMWSLMMTYYYTILPIVGAVIAAFFTLYVIDFGLKYYVLFAFFIISFAIVTTYMGNRLAGFYGQLYKTTEKLMGRVYEFVSHVRLVKAVSLSPHLLKRAATHEQECVYQRGRVSINSCWFWFCNNIVGLFWVGFIIFLGIQDVISGEMLVGTFVTLAFTASRIWDYMESFSEALMQLIEHKASVMRGVSLLQEVPEQVDVRPFKKLPARWDAIRFDAVSFSYGSDTEAVAGPALKEVSLTIKRGEHVGIVGYSGSGKSTLIKLLMKQALPISGEVMVGAVPLKNIKRDAYVSEIALVPQEVDLFNDSLRENITVTANVSDKKLKTVLKKAYVDEFLDQLPEGLETVIGERGVKLSGGQKQRLGIARAIARDSEIVIFDEATSALDSVSERYIQESIKLSFKKKTMVVIAHRLATIAHLDRIIVMDKGKVAEQGTHDELIARGGIYARMWRLQSDGFLPDKA